ncbi:hypothetical protein LWI29_003364 [Acer saccharum]|uniref:RNase H type-1 domain-containing protein n=1 Tax=Acer saccharum TaxID=4024 RepID=A0AA39RFG4_ACESA|nr:hypothetical protein LWI29_003364 [Acer saccharum]
MFENLNCNKFCLESIPGYLLFTVTLWFIWKWICAKVFDSNFQPPLCPGKIIWKYVDYWLAINSVIDKDVAMKNCAIFWTPPPPPFPPLDWVKLNVDGRLNPDLNSIAVGGIIRDNEKNWLMGFALNKGLGSIIEAELWGIFEGLKLA